jgi:hypothetical protein
MCSFVRALNLVNISQCELVGAQALTERTLSFMLEFVDLPKIKETKITHVFVTRRLRPRPIIGTGSSSADSASQSIRVQISTYSPSCSDPQNGGCVMCSATGSCVHIQKLGKEEEYYPPSPRRHRAG